MLFVVFAAAAQDAKPPVVELSANVQPRATLLTAAGDGVSDAARFAGSGFRVRRTGLIATAMAVMKRGGETAVRP